MAASSCGILHPALRSALERAARNIELFHSVDPPRTVELETEPGVTVGRRPDPLQRVGIYSPGGRAAYASSVRTACVSPGGVYPQSALAVSGSRAVTDAEDVALKIYLYSRAQSVMGGTSQIQKNIIATRILGLPTA